MPKTKTILPAIILTNDETQMQVRNPNDGIVSNAQVVFGWKFIKVPVTEIDIDLTYQRKQTDNAVDKIIANWNEELYEPIKVAYRDGRFKAWDGGKRLLAQMKMGRTEVVCRLYDEKSMYEEVRLFTCQGDCITKLKPVDYFKANVVMGEPIDTIIKEVCDKYGVTIMQREQIDNMPLGSITEARSIVRTHGRAGLEWIMRVIQESKMTNYGFAYSSNVLRSLKTIYLRHVFEQEIVFEKLVSGLPKNSRQWLISAQEKFPHLDRRAAMAEWVESEILDSYQNKA